MKSPNIKYLWADLIVEELVRCGVTKFCISPGSRNSPLVLAAAENKNAETIVHPDERGAAFYAVGYAKATGHSAVLICTSGTAAANYFPAVIEASASTVPLLILSADRPIELRDTKANQTIDQVDIYGNYVRWSFDLPSPNRDMPAEFVLTTVNHAIYRAIRTPAGPVQLNCMFAEPLTPDPDDSIPTGYTTKIAGWEKSDRPYTEYASAQINSDDASIDKVRQKLHESQCGLIVAGRRNHRDDAAALCELAKRLKWPLLADISSGLRFGSYSKDNLVTCYDLFLRDSAFVKKYRPDLILHLGDPIISKSLNQYIENSGAEYVVVNDTPYRQDSGHSVTFRLEIKPVDFCQRMADVDSDNPSELLPVLRRADSICFDLLFHLDIAGDFTNEFAIAYQLLSLFPGDDGLFLANSMPVRDADSCGLTGEKIIHIGVNRGASGIDGNIATTVGFADGLRKRTILLIGDLAFLHDMNSLLLLKNSTVPITIVLLNNNGGGIFSFLPISGFEEHFEKYFATPHDLSFKEAAAFFGVKHFHPETMSEFREDCIEAFGMDESCIIEIQTDRRQNVTEHREIWNRISDAIREELL